MVKEVDKGPEIRVMEERKRRLAQIAEEVLGTSFSVRNDRDFNLLVITDTSKDSKPSFYVNLCSNTIRVYHKDILEPARTVARTYESKGEPEFTLERNYA